MSTALSRPSSKPFSAFPSAWVHQGLLVRLKDGPVLAALKLYLAVICWAGKLDFEGQPDGVFLTTSPSFDELQLHTGLDRSEIAPALQLLKQEGLLYIQASKGCRSIYQVAGYPQQGWAKVPLELITEKRLRELSLKYTGFPVHERKQALRDTLKLYLVFLALRNNHTNRAKVSYDSLTRLTGVRRIKIRRAISLLVELNLIYSENSYTNSPMGGYRPACNTYFLLGLADFKPKRDLIVDPSSEVLAT